MTSHNNFNIKVSLKKSQITGFPCLAHVHVAAIL